MKQESEIPFSTLAASFIVVTLLVLSIMLILGISFENSLVTFGNPLSLVYLIGLNTSSSVLGLALVLAIIVVGACYIFFEFAAMNITIKVLFSNKEKSIQSLAQTPSIRLAIVFVLALIVSSAITSIYQRNDYSIYTNFLRQNDNSPSFSAVSSVDAGGSWRIEDGIITGGGSGEAHHFITFTETVKSFQTQIQLDRTIGDPWRAGIMMSVKNSNEYLLWTIGNDGQQNKAWIAQRSENGWKNLTESILDVDPEQISSMAISNDGEKLSAYINGKLAATVGTYSISTNTIGLRVYNAEATFTPIDTIPNNDGITIYEQMYNAISASYVKIPVIAALITAGIAIVRMDNARKATIYFLIGWILCFITLIPFWKLLSPNGMMLISTTLAAMFSTTILLIKRSDAA